MNNRLVYNLHFNDSLYSNVKKKSLKVETNLLLNSNFWFLELQENIEIIYFAFQLVLGFYKHLPHTLFQPMN